MLILRRPLRGPIALVVAVALVAGVALDPGQMFAPPPVGGVLGEVDLRPEEVVAQPPHDPAATLPRTF